MLDFAALDQKQTSLAELTRNLTLGDLKNLTNEMIDQMLLILADARDNDIVFHPVDPAANDRFAANPADITLAWTLGHVVVHATASAEEAAALPTSMARGVPVNDRSRYEMPWQDMKTMTQARARLEESRRMRLAFLNAWPDSPHLEIVNEPWPGAEPVNAVGRFVMGLLHDFHHLEQMQEILRQSQNTPEEKNS
ncbi:MAG: DinB family protein [Anaerolineae bacterium]|nr:DinB family protein [Anaerolineae bacterium]